MRLVPLDELPAVQSSQLKELYPSLMLFSPTKEVEPEEAQLSSMLQSGDQELRELALDELEKREMNRVRESLSRISEDVIAEELVGPLAAVVYRRVAKSFRPMIVRLGETMASKIIDFVHGEASGFYVESIIYGDLVQVSSGVICLGEGEALTLRFASTLSLQFLFDPEQGQDEHAEFRHVEGGIGQILIGKQDKIGFKSILLGPVAKPDRPSPLFKIQLFFDPILVAGSLTLSYSLFVGGITDDSRSTD